MQTQFNFKGKANVTYLCNSINCYNSGVSINRIKARVYFKVSKISSISALEHFWDIAFSEGPPKLMFMVICLAAVFFLAASQQSQLPI